MSVRQKASITQCKLWKNHLLSFMILVSPNDKWFYSYLGTTVGPSQMKILSTSYYQNISFRNNVLLTQFTKVFVAPINYNKFGSRCYTLQYNPRSSYMQTRWPTQPTIFLTVRFYTGSQLPITNANILRMK